MLSRTAILWIVYALVMGFVLGASIFSPQIAPNQSRPINGSDARTEKSITDIAVPKSADDRIANYTWWLAAFTLALVVVSAVQIHFLIRSDETARISADAAKRSTDAAIALELPLIRAEIGKVGYSDFLENARPKRKVWIAAAYFANIGKTKAFPIEMQIGCSIGNALPKIPIYAFKKDFPINTMLTENEHEVSLREFDFDVPLDIYDQLRASSMNLWFFCNLVYLDFMQTRHEAGFCWKRQESIGLGRFVRDPTSAYNRRT